MEVKYGRALRVVRAARNLSQGELAERAGLDASYVSLVESGKRAPSPAKVETLAGALNVPAYLLTFLASEQNELLAISEDEAGMLGRHLLRVVTDSDNVQAQEPSGVKRKGTSRGRR